MSEVLYTFNIDPMGKPRMTRADAWKKRSCVCSYYLFKDRLNIMAKKQGFRIRDRLDLIAYIPMPKSWSEKKKRDMDRKPCLQKPDADNILKAFMDCLLTDDAAVWDVRCRKYWAKTGEIRVLRAES